MSVSLKEQAAAAPVVQRPWALSVVQEVVAVPVAAAETCDEFRRDVDQILCGMTPEPFHAVGLWYEDFGQTTDEEVRELLHQAMVPSNVVSGAGGAGHVGNAAHGVG